MIRGFETASEITRYLKEQFAGLFQRFLEEQTRIKEISILLMEEGYLKYNTMESLALETGFTSYSSFFKSFKSITGLPPYEYNNQ